MILDIPFKQRQFFISAALCCYPAQMYLTFLVGRHYLEIWHHFETTELLHLSPTQNEKESLLAT